MSTSQVLTAGVLTLAWFAAVNLAGSATVVLAARLFDDRLVARASRARRLMAVRFAPAAAGIIAAGGLFLPAHLWLEPAAPDERLGALPIAFAAAGFVLLASTALRLAGIARTSRRLASHATRELRRGSVRLTEVPALPGIALAGIVKPRILIGSQARRVLTGSELDVAIAHERAHQRAGDNLTRVMMRCAPDFLAWSRTARRLERLWAAEAECLADAAAAGANATRAAKLASALVKIAKLAARETAWRPEWSTLHQPALLESRVRLLTSEVLVRPSSGGWTSRAVALTGILLTTAWIAGVPGELHWLTERLLQLL